MSGTQEILDTIGEALRRVLEADKELPSNLRALLASLAAQERQAVSCPDVL